MKGNLRQIKLLKLEFEIDSILNTLYEIQNSTLY